MANVSRSDLGTVKLNDTAYFSPPSMFDLQWNDFSFMHLSIRSFVQFSIESTDKNEIFECSDSWSFVMILYIDCHTIKCRGISLIRNTWMIHWKWVFRSNESDKRSFSKSITRLKLLIASCQSCETHDEWLLWAGTLVLVLFVSEQWLIENTIFHILLFVSSDFSEGEWTSSNGVVSETVWSAQSFLNNNNQLDSKNFLTFYVQIPLHQVEEVGCESTNWAWFSFFG